MKEKKKMTSQKQAEEEMISSFNETENEEKEEENNKEEDSIFSLKGILWHGGSVYDAWFSCASNQVLLQIHHCSNFSLLVLHILFNQKILLFSFFGFLQVAQVLLTLPYSFSQMGMLSGIILQVFYGIMGSWTAYLISVLYVEYRSRKEKENVSFKNHVIQVNFPRTTLNFSFKLKKKLQNKNKL